MFRHDAQHTGRYPAPPTLDVSPDSLYVLHQSGDPNTEHATLIIRNTGELTFALSITPPSGVTAFPTSGTMVTQTIVMITVSTAGRPNGTHNLGNISVAGRVGGVHIANSPVSVPVTLYVGQLYRSFLPVVLKR
jgi:hypothetical protein